MNNSSPIPGPSRSVVDNLEQDLSELLGRVAEGNDEAALLEQAHALISKALGQA